MAAPDLSRVYLVELMDPFLESIQKVDVTAHLANALQMVGAHLADFPGKVDVEVTLDPGSGNLSGVVYFNEFSAPISVVRAYYLLRDELECQDLELLAHAQGPLKKLEAGLNAHINKGKF